MKKVIVSMTFVFVAVNLMISFSNIDLNDLNAVSLSYAYAK